MKTFSQSWGAKCDVFGVRTRLNPFLESPSYILGSKSNILENKNLKNIKARFLANKQVYFILWTDIVLNHASCKTMEISIKCKQQW